MKISCEENRPVMVFVYDAGTYKVYSCCISSKRYDGSYIKVYMPLIFPSGVCVRDRDMINIKDGFLTALSGGKSRLAIYVRDFEVISNEE